MGTSHVSSAAMHVREFNDDDPMPSAHAKFPPGLVSIDYLHSHNSQLNLHVFSLHFRLLENTAKRTAAPDLSVM